MNSSFQEAPRLASHVATGDIRNIIFDFGGVLCNIDVERTKKAFIGLGQKRFDTGQSITRTTGLFEALETGTIAPAAFRDHVRKMFDHPVSDEAIDTAWNALLLDFPEPRVRLLEALKGRYRIFLLSNSNVIHYDSYSAQFARQYGYRDLDALFEKAWFSYRIGLKKPDREIFEFVLRDGGLDPNETLFIDDTLVHVEGARSAGLHGWHLDLTGGDEVTALFSR